MVGAAGGGRGLRQHPRRGLRLRRHHRGHRQPGAARALLPGAGLHHGHLGLPPRGLLVGAHLPPAAHALLRARPPRRRMAPLELPPHQHRPARRGERGVLPRAGEAPARPGGGAHRGPRLRGAPAAHRRGLVHHQPLGPRRLAGRARGLRLARPQGPRGHPRGTARPRRGAALQGVRGGGAAAAGAARPAGDGDHPRREALPLRGPCARARGRHGASHGRPRERRDARPGPALQPPSRRLARGARELGRSLRGPGGEDARRSARPLRGLRRSWARRRSSGSPCWRCARGGAIRW